MSEMKLCPFCGWEFAEHAWNEFGEEYRVCDQCGASSGTVDSKWDWQSRPIEDALRKRIAVLEALVERLIEAGKQSMNFTEGFCNNADRDKPEYWHNWNAIVAEYKECEE